MTKVRVACEIAASESRVFEVVSDIDGLPQGDPDVLRVEYLGERHAGVGTRFRDVRLVRGKELHSDLTVTELEEPTSIRMVSDTHGTVWDTRYEVRAGENGSTLTVTMEATPHAALPKVLNPLMRGMFRKGIAKHAQAVKAYCEGRG